MKRNPFQDTILLFHSACGGEDGIASFKLPNGEEVHWRLRPYSLTQVAAVDLFRRGGRRTIDLTPGRVALQVGASPETLRNWVELYDRYGPDALDSSQASTNSGHLTCPLTNARP
jgi:hypothetical protein